jgi:acid-sensing ion channel 3
MQNTFYKTGNIRINYLAYILNHLQYYCFSFVWLFMIVVMAIALSVVLYRSFKRFSEYPTVTSMNAIFHEELEFPAVTICNHNMYRSSIVNCSHYDVYKYFNLDTVFHEISGVSILEDLLVPPGRTREEDIPGSVLRKCALEYSHKLEDMFVLCLWRGTRVPCKDLFIQIETSMGMCFKFNSNTSSVRFSKTSGDQSGLQVLINIQQTEYFYSQNTHVGIKVRYRYLHSFRVFTICLLFQEIIFLFQ